MANDNNNINNLVADDDDPTVELELPILRQGTLEGDAKTFNSAEHGVESRSASASTVAELTSELRVRQKSIDHLQYDLQQLQTKSLGLETEVNAREVQGHALHSELAAVHDNALRKERLLKKRDRNIKTLKAEIRQRDSDQSTLSKRCGDLQISLDKATRIEHDAGSPGSTPNSNPNIELQARLTRSNEYADTMRRQLQDLMEAHSSADREIDHLSSALETATRKCLDLTDVQAILTGETDELTEQLDNIQSRHNEEMHILRFELTDAQSTMAESDHMNTQLASDLVDVQSIKIKLENMLNNAEEQSNSRIEKLQKEKTKIERSNRNLEQKLEAKSGAITALLTELAKKSEQIEAIGEEENIDQDLDECMPERGSGETPASDERVSKVLVGSVDGQMLSFPLFKDRLTIGRTKDNDVQLDAAYISRRHAVIQTDDTNVRIIDWGSKNGIHVNSQRVDEHFLEHGDVIMIGNARFRYEEHKKKDA